MRLDRLLAIIVKLLNRDKIPGRELAEEFEVSVRTIYRDMEAINLAGIPIITFPGQQGGFGIMESFRLDRHVLTLPEISSLLAVARGMAPVLADRQINRAAEKISSLVPREQQRLLQTQADQMVIDILPRGTSGQQKERLALIQQAVSGQRLLRLTYRNAQGKSLQRTLEPLTLVFKTHLWYCFAYCRLKKDFRFFRLSRMRRLVTLKEHFVRKEKSFRDFETKQPGQVKMVSLVLKFSPRIRYRAEDYFDENQIRVQKDGSLHVRLTWPEDEWLYNFLLGYGEDMEVLEPARIREIVARKTLKTAALYAPDSVQPKSIAAVQKPPRRQA